MVGAVVALGLILVCASTDIALDMPAIAAMAAMLAGWSGAVPPASWRGRWRFRRKTGRGGS